MSGCLRFWVGCFAIGAVLLSAVASAQQMSTALRSVPAGNGGITGFGVLPSNDPYCGSGPGEFECLNGGATVATSLPDDVVDWVLVELRSVPQSNASAGNATEAASLIVRKPGLLLSNGRVIDPDLAAGANVSAASCGEIEESVADCPGLSFSSTELPAMTHLDGRRIYVVIHHRNHLAVISSESAEQSGGTRYWDFTGSIDQAYNGGQDGQSLAKSAVAMIGGDANSDGSVIFGSDYNLGAGAVRVLLDRSGYLGADTNMDGSVIFGSDYNFLLRLNLDRSTQVPR